MRNFVTIAATAALFICPTAMAQPANPDARTPAVNARNSPPSIGMQVGSRLIPAQPRTVRIRFAESANSIVKRPLKQELPLGGSS